MVKEGPPRELKPVAPAKADVVIFTDGFFPDPRRSEKGPARVGAVMFDRRRVHPVQFSEIVPKEVIDKWISRATQIFMVELVATILALETFRHYLQNTIVLLLVDAEAVEGALVKGYSSRSDVSLLVGKFRELALMGRLVTRSTSVVAWAGLKSKLGGQMKFMRMVGPGDR